METTDALGRRRRVTQSRGLRPLFPKLPTDFQSRLIRLAMSTRAWARIESLVAHSSAPTLPRAFGEVVERLLENFDSASQRTNRSFIDSRFRQSAEPEEKRTAHWQDWQMRKELALLAAASERSHGLVAQEIN